MALTINDLKRLKNRDPLILEKLYNEYKQKIYHFLLIRTGGNRDVTEEIFSETFVNALNNISNLKNINNINKIQEWLIQIAHQRLADYLRKKYKMHDNIESLNQEAEIDKKDMELSEKNANKKKMITLNMAMKNIKSQYSEILHDKYILELSINDIAKKLKKSKSSVESLLFRARESLKKELKKIGMDNINE